MLIIITAVVRTVYGNSNRFEVKVSMHQGSGNVIVISTAFLWFLLFSICRC